MKKCSQCGVSKPAGDYYANGRQPCKPCHQAAMKTYREANAETVRERKRDAYRNKGGAKQNRDYRQRNKARTAARMRARELRLSYGITPEDYDELALAQGDMCAICGLEETVRHRSGDGVRPLSVDHNHETGVVRALLCGRCNAGLGMFRDDRDLLLAASVYLDLHNQRNSA